MTDFSVHFKVKGGKQFIVQLPAIDYLDAIYKAKQELIRVGYIKPRLVSCRPVDDDIDELEEVDEW